MAYMKNTENLAPVDRIRMEKGISRSELSRRTGVPARTLEDWSARKNTNPSARHLYAVALALGCRMEDLIEPELWEQRKDEFHG